MMYLQVIYDFDNRYPAFTSVMFPTIFLVIGIALWYRNKGNNNSQESTQKINKTSQSIRHTTGLIYLVMALGLFLYVCIDTIRRFNHVKTVYHSQDLKTTEGVIDFFMEAQYSPSASDEFTINKIPFTISTTDNSEYGYNQLKEKGGVLSEGQKVKISYYNNGIKNIILRLELL